MSDQTTVKAATAPQLHKEVLDVLKDMSKEKDALGLMTSTLIYLGSITKGREVYKKILTIIKEKI